MSDARSRYAVAQELAGHNGAQPDFWRDALLEAFSALDDDRRGGRESRSFTFYTAADITTNAPVEPQWAVKPWLPLGGITELDGKVKSSGKTTFTLAMCRQILDGAPFLGIPQ
jgi:hypothetical protein